MAVSTLAQTPSPNLNDQALLAAEPGFIARIQQSLVSICTAIVNEAESTAFHYSRLSYSVQIMTTLFNTATPYAKMFAVAVSTDTSIIGDATVGGTVPLTSGNVPTQGLLVTDAHINNAVSAQFNSFITKTR